MQRENGAKPAKKRKKLKSVIIAVVGLAIMAAVFFFLFPQFGDYGEAFALIKVMSPWWMAAFAAVSLVNIAVYPLTAIAAIPGLAYRKAFASRQAAFAISNVIPGGGAVAVGVQYSVLAGYEVPSGQAAAAVTADGVWTYLITLAAPSVAVLMLVVQGVSVYGLKAAAAIGLIVVVTSLLVIAVTLRSEHGARKIGGVIQRPLARVFAVLRKPAPDITARLVDFHDIASEMVSHRWRSLTLTSLAAQAAPFVVLLAALAALGVVPEPLTLVKAFAAYSVALLLTMVPVTPGGLGTVDAALVALLVGFGVEPSSALAADLIWRLVWFVPQLMVGLGALGLYQWDKRALDRVGARGDHR